jgi:hypothetical protein
MSKLSFKGFISEARREDLSYQEEKTKGVIDKVIVELNGSESATATKLARRYTALSTALEKMEAVKKELNAQLTGIAEGLFDDVEDIVRTRVVATASFTLTLGKVDTNPKAKSEVNYEKVYKALIELIDDELKPKVDEIIKENTKTWTPEIRKAALRVKEIDESLSLAESFSAIKNSLKSVVEGIKKQVRQMVSSLKVWGRSYDRKLVALQKEAGKTVVESVDLSESALDADEVFDQFVDAHRLYNFEGQTGVRNLTKIVNVLGYSDIQEFLMDNSGAIEGIIEWIKEWIEHNDEWKQSLINSLNESVDLTEGNQYDSSIDFENAVSSVEKNVKDALKTVKSSQWKDWMRKSADNFGTASPTKSRELEASLTTAQKQLDKLYEELVNAS